MVMSHSQAVSPGGESDCLSSVNKSLYGSQSAVREHKYGDLSGCHIYLCHD